MKTLSLSLTGLLLAASFAQAGAVVNIDDEAKIDIGFRVQPLVIITESDLDGDGSLESETDFKVRRGRLRLKGTINDYVSAFIQTDLGSATGGGGYDWRVIDAFVTIKACDYLSIIAGQNMAPASRQNATSSGALMAIDRPGVNYKTLTWGARSLYAFANRTISDTDSGLRGEVDVRDNGVTLFSSTSLTDDLHLKTYLGLYDGIQLDSTDDPRITARAQLNMMDAEAGYYNSSTYLGKKTTVAIGASYDTQSNVADSNDKGMIDYNYYTVDVFAEMPCGPGAATIEAAYANLDLDGATSLDLDNVPETAGMDATRAEGDGYYIQAGYLVDKVQPWVGYEHWDSNAADGKGTYDLFRVGVSYFIKGQNANIKAGFERLESDTTLAATAADTIDSFVLGCYVTY